MDKDNNGINKTDRNTFFLFFRNISTTEMCHYDFDAVLFLDDLSIAIQWVTQ